MFAGRRFLLILLVTALCITGPFLFGYHFTAIRSSAIDYLYSLNSTASGQYLHVLLPATAANTHLCRLLLSAGITGYPDPVVIGWQGRGIFNGEETHLFKITETLAYLRSLPTAMDNDMVLVLDAYDIWLQLRVDVMISRYDQVIIKQNQRLKDQGIFGKSHAGSDVRQTIIFGADKLCWPQDSRQPSCWVVPQSDMPERAFGPNTDREMFVQRPRWINSGTIMGPVKDMRDLFAATVDMMSLIYDPAYNHRTSDQYYFEELWAEQEINRELLRVGGREHLVPHNFADGSTSDWPEVPRERRTEYHITLDYNTEMFQTMAAFDYHLTWMAYNHTTPTHQGMRRKTRRIDEWVLAGDVQASRPPFAAFGPWDTSSADKNWADVPLGTNTVTQNVFPLFHVTGDKSIRERWWPRMWFHPHAEELLLAERKRRTQQDDSSVFAVVNGVEWRDPLHRPQLGNESPKGGVWTTRGTWIPFPELCEQHEDKLYIRQGGE